MNIKKNQIYKFSLTGATALTLSMSITPSIVTLAESNNVESVETSSEQIHPIDNSIMFSSETVSEADTAYLQKVSSMAENFYLDENDNAQINLTKEQLVNQYNFSSIEAEELLNALNNQAVESTVTPGPIDDGSIVTPNLHVSGGKVYISNMDLNSTAFAAIATASTLGPAALKGAFIAASTAIGGPVGTAISGIMALIGGPGLIDIAGHITTALITGEGVYIGPQFRYPFVDVGYWSGT